MNPARNLQGAGEGAQVLSIPPGSSCAHTPADRRLECLRLCVVFGVPDPINAAERMFRYVETGEGVQCA